jgi:hypothetical protein
MAMRRTLLITVAVIAALAAVPAAGAIALQTAAPVKVHVSPGAGGPRTAFAVSWRNPAQTGVIGSFQRSETVDVSGPQHRGCVSSGQIAVPATAAQQLIRMSLTPARMSTSSARKWCTGTFHGAIVQSQRFACSPPPTQLCPQLEIRPQTIARFTFKVKRRA